MRGVDYSWARPGGAAIREAGFEFAMRYVPYPGDGGKGLGAEEIADLRANGLAFGLVFESAAGRMFDGYPAGAEDAQQSEASVTTIGFPVSLPIYFACDVDTWPEMLALIDDYLQGCASVLGAGRVGVYGEFDVVEHCHEAGTATWFWQTYAWSGGQRSDWNHVYQYLNGQTLNGGAVDYNEAAEEFGQWKPEEDDMDDATVKRLASEVIAADFPEYLEAYWRREFSERNGIVDAKLNPEGKDIVKPWLEDLIAPAELAARFEAAARALRGG